MRARFICVSVAARGRRGPRATRGAWRAAPGGRSARSSARSGGSGTASRRCACGSAASARPTGRSATRSPPRSTCTASRQYECACAPSDESSWCRPCRKMGTRSGARDGAGRWCECGRGAGSPAPCEAPAAAPAPGWEFAPATAPRSRSAAHTSQWWRMWSAWWWQCSEPWRALAEETRTAWPLAGRAVWEAEPTPPPRQVRDACLAPLANTAPSRNMSVASSPPATASTRSSPCQWHLAVRGTSYRSVVRPSHFTCDADRWEKMARRNVPLPRLAND